MKKILSASLAMLFLALCALPAFAGTASQAQSMEISTSGVVAYEFAFPADTEIPWEAAETDIGAVTALKLNIEPTKVVKISVTSENDYALVNTQDAEKQIAYTLSGADSIAFYPGDADKAFPLVANVSDAQWAQAASGEHRDRLTFTMEYTNA